MSLEQTFRAAAAAVALALESASVLMIALGAAKALRRGFRQIRMKPSPRELERTVFVHFGSWLLLGLEFSLGADVVRTAIAPTWNEIGQLAAIAVIRTFLNYFLERDIDALQARGLEPLGEQPGAP